MAEITKTNVIEHYDKNSLNSINHSYVGFKGNPSKLLNYSF